VTRRWLDPDGDGDPSDGVDGFRLDVAEMVPLGFWREYRSFVRAIHPEAYLVGEVWWEQWPETMYDPAPGLQGDVFDAVMNYRWYMPTRSFFAGTPPGLTATEYVAALDSAAAAGYSTLWRGVWDRNARAIAFYERWGFARVGSHPFQLGGGRADGSRDGTAGERTEVSYIVTALPGCFRVVRGVFHLYCCERKDPSATVGMT